MLKTCTTLEGIHYVILTIFTTLRRASQYSVPVFLDKPGLEFINLEYILRLKIKRNDWLLADYKT